VAGAIASGITAAKAMPNRRTRDLLKNNGARLMFCHRGCGKLERDKEE